ncbi:short-chain dehydrogenase [Frateuria sp. Soil773]|uniref:NnrS family protein n=1 Tax=Frateuria sp. Soil773 TaxID=1736407 RepID=UPI0006F7288A|nr:NnrS family protein [Frateuria sp. Soil773]KRF01810.1 short-chain dehydrogenase [Frateuria sp. Soil773]
MRDVRPPAMEAGMKELPALLASAPHRLLFFAGALAVLTSMAWWTLELVSLRFGLAGWPQPPVPPGWAHAVLTEYGMLPLFMFGFLLTVFPRWLGQPALPRARYVPVAGAVFGGYLLAHAGLLDAPWLLRAGLALMLAGYLLALATLGGVLRAARSRDRHALSCLAAFALGALGLAAFLAFLSGAPAACALLAVKLGTFGLLLPVYFTVSHRMIPFFSGNVAAGYVVRRPAWSLPLVWTLLLAHLLIDLGGEPAWLWVVDAPLALAFGWHALAWQPWKARRPGLLAVLHLAFAWLPLAFALYALQSLWLMATQQPVLGLAPLHVLTIGYFGSMLVAMVTRVTQGHSGRPLQMGAVPWLCFALLQGVLLLRVRAELGGDAYLWLVLAAAGWLLAFLPWVLRALWIYLTPRRDGKPG